MMQYSDVDLIEASNEMRVNFVQLTSTRRTSAKINRHKPVIASLYFS